MIMLPVPQQRGTPYLCPAIRGKYCRQELLNISLRRAQIHPLIFYHSWKNSATTDLLLGHWRQQ